jgi:hypothetical protein
MGVDGMRQVVLRVLALPALLMLLFYSVSVTAAWWQDEIELTSGWNWFWVGLLPLLIVLWWRYFSIFGCKNPACLLPEDESVKKSRCDEKQ